MENALKSIVAAVSDPVIMLSFWGGVGGLITAIIKKRRSVMQILSSMILAALFANWFALAIVEFFDLPTQSLGGVGAILGITSYEVTRVLVTGEWVVWIRVFILNRGNKNE